MSCGSRWRARCSSSHAPFVKPAPPPSSPRDMRQVFLPLLVAALASPALAQQQELQRAVVQRDQQSAEFAAQLRGGQDLKRLENLHAQQLRETLVPLSPDAALAGQLLPYQRST